MDPNLNTRQHIFDRPCNIFTALGSYQHRKSLQFLVFAVLVLLPWHIDVENEAVLSAGGGAKQAKIIWLKHESLITFRHI